MPLGKETLQPIKLLSCWEMCARISGFVNCPPCWVTAGFVSYLLQEGTPHLYSLSNPNDTCWFTKLDFGYIYSLLWYVTGSISGLSRHMCHLSPGNIFSHNQEQDTKRAMLVIVSEAFKIPSSTTFL